jgi:outer membrane receptor protein involved in Fe transport
MLLKPTSVFVLLILSVIGFNNNLYGQGDPLLLKGRVTGESGKPLAAATVSLLDADSTAAKAVTDSNGRFSIAHHLKAPYTLLISHTGYTAYKSAAFDNPYKDFGNIPLTLQGATLKAVTVQSKQPLVTLEGGNIVFNVAKSINAQGVDALEVLKKAPGVYVDNETSISLNGKQGALILLDGKQTYLSGKELIDLLKSMPSSGIKSIEIINSPTAKYDAASSAGIINIKTMKSQAKGLTGNFTTGIAYGISLKQNQDLSFNYRKNKFNLYGSYNHFIGNYNYVYGSDRTQSNKTYQSATDDTDKRKKMGTRLGLDYNINKKHTIGILLNGNFVFGGGITKTTTDIGTPGSSAIEQTLTAANDYYYQETDRYNVNVNYKYENEAGTILNLDADYGSFKKGNANLQSNAYTDPQETILSQNLYRSLNNIDINLRAFKADYTTNIWQGTLEAGAKYSDISTANNARFFHVLSSKDSLDDRRSNTFDFSEQITSGYLNYKKTIGKWAFQGGLRIEHTSSKGSLFFKAGNHDSTQNISKNYTDFFPSGSISLKLNEANNLSFAYAKRLDRPAYQDLNPFIYLLDELSFWQGNPFLQPQYTDRLTLQYVYKSSTIVAVSYASTNDYSARITDTLQTSSIVMIPRNLGTQQVLSFSLTQTYAPFKWWDLNFTGTLNHVQNKIAFDKYRNMELKQLAGRASLQQRFKLPFSLVGEVSGYFNTKRLLGANEVMNGVSQVDLGLQKTILKNKGTLRLIVTDIYKGSRANSFQQFEGFQLSSYSYYETRQVKLNFTYKFGDAAGKGPRARNSALENENGRIK